MGITEVLVLWTILGGCALAIAGKDLLEFVKSDLAGLVMVLAFGPVSWTILAIALLGDGLDRLVEGVKSWRH